ncbi:MULTISPECIES: DUF3800 domain-containing protein [Pseudomonas]
MGKSNLTQYIAYLDEFGHVGQYVSRKHPMYKTSPVFGLGGMLIPAQEVREFAIYFYKLKCQLLAWDSNTKTHNIYRPTIGKRRALRCLLWTM